MSVSRAWAARGIAVVFCGSAGLASWALVMQLTYRVEAHHPGDRLMASGVCAAVIGAAAALFIIASVGYMSLPRESRSAALSVTGWAALIVLGTALVDIIG